MPYLGGVLSNGHPLRIDVYQYSSTPPKMLNRTDGQAKREGSPMSDNKKICSDCVSDAYLKGVIDQSQETDQACDYCGRVAPTIEMGSLAEMCNEVIDNFYEVSSLTDAVIHYGWTAKGSDLPEILYTLLDPPSDAVDDLVGLLGEMWFDWSSHEHQYGEDPSFIEKSSLGWELGLDWRQMEDSLRYEARFLNPAAANLLEKIFGSIEDDRTQIDGGVVVHLGAGSELDTLFRARVFQTTDAMEDAFEHPERHFGPPPPGKGSAGRMNAKGLPVFYGATKPEVAISEVRPPVGGHVVVAQFKVIRPLRVLDLRKLGTIKLKPDASYFDPDTVKQATRNDFLRGLTHEIGMPVVPELEDHQYIVTQAIADFLATHQKLNLDGIIFPSAQHLENETVNLGSNVILFNKASVVKFADQQNSKRTQVYLFEHDEDGRRLEPRIWTEVRLDESKNMWQSRDLPVPVLQLDLDAISIYSINGVRYETSSLSVSRTVKASSQNSVTDETDW